MVVNLYFLFFYFPFFLFHSATLRVLRSMVGMSAHVVCMAEFTVNAHDVYVTT